MPRQLPGGVVAPARLATRERETLFDLTIDVVTPIFGGGAAPGTVDPDDPIRGPSVRGHLRFWWRACNAHRFSTEAALFAEESAIWGRSAGDNAKDAPAAIEIDIEVDPERRSRLVDSVEWKRSNSGSWNPAWDNKPGYALWPFQGKLKRNARPVGAIAPSDWEVAPKQALVGVRFRLRLFIAPGREDAATTIRDAAEQAVWAWLTFGGIGARTRRGCGALWCATVDRRFQPDADVRAWLTTRAAECITGEPRDGAGLPLPMLHGARLLLGPPMVTARSPVPALAAWKAAVVQLQTFRQGAGVGRRSERGRSHWPEADSIRNLTPDLHHRHEPEFTGRYFPRAELGLPIVFHFVNEGGTPDATLKIAEPGATRMASPIVLKALPAAAGTDAAPTTFLPMALCMSAPLVSEKVGPESNRRHLRVQLEIENPNGKQIEDVQPNEVMDATTAASIHPLNQQGTDNPRDAFMSFVQSRWPGEMLTLPGDDA